MRVILVRHAETQWNNAGIIQGHSDSPLTPRGQRETSLLLEALLEKAYPIDRIYASPLGRAWHMGLSLAEGLCCPLLAEPALKEQGFGHFEGMYSADFIRHYPNEAEALFRLDAKYCPPGGESLLTATRRLMYFLQHLQNAAEHQTICLVSHGHILQGVLAMLKEGNIDNFPRYSQPNASYSVFELDEGKCTALQWGIATDFACTRQSGLILSYLPGFST